LKPQNTYPDLHRFDHISLTATDLYKMTCLLPSFLFSLDYLAALHVHFLGFVSVGFGMIGAMPRAFWADSSRPSFPAPAMSVLECGHISATNGPP